jgi:hypothetical protein
MSEQTLQMIYLKEEIKPRKGDTKKYSTISSRRRKLKGLLYIAGSHEHLVW